MEPIMIGAIVLFVIFAIIGFALYSGLSGPVGWVSAIFPSAGTGILGVILGIFTDAWQYLVSCMYGELGLPGYLFIGMLGVLLTVWIINGFLDMKNNRPLSFWD